MRTFAMVKGSGQVVKKRIARGQAVKAHFRRSRILTAVVNGPTVSIGVTTPCFSVRYLESIHSMTRTAEISYIRLTRNQKSFGKWACFW